MLRMGAFSGCDNLTELYIYNKEINIEFSTDTIPENAVIYSYCESAAHAYAWNYGYDFVALEGSEHSYSEWIIEKYQIFILMKNMIMLKK